MSIPRLVKNTNTGIYEVRFSDHGRSRVRSLHLKDEQEAMKAFAEWLNNERNKVKESLDPSMDSVFDWYMQEHVETMVVAKERQEQCLNALKQHFGSMKPRDIGFTETMQYGHSRTLGKYGRKVGGATVRREIGMLRAAINWGIKSGRLKLDSLNHMFIPKQLPPKDVYLSMENLEEVLKAAEEFSPRINTFCKIAAYTAARKGTIENLTWERVNLDLKIINFDDGSIRTKKRKVKVPINDKLMSHFQTINPNHVNTDDYVLGNNTLIYREFHNFKEFLKLKHPENEDLWDKITPHTFRHTWATLAAQSGVSMFDIAGVLGDTIQTVTRVYVHHSPSYLRSAVSFL